MFTLLTQPGAGLAVACFAAMLAGAYALLRPVLHTFQLESYRACALLKYYAHHPYPLLRPMPAVLAGLLGWWLLPLWAGSWLPHAAFCGLAAFFAAAVAGQLGLGDLGGVALVGGDQVIHRLGL